VIFGQHDLENFPGTYYTKRKNDFINKIDMAAKKPFEKEKVALFIKDATWESRIIQLSAEIDKKKKYQVNTPVPN
jgi:hypothetical protein